MMWLVRELMSSGELPLLHEMEERVRGEEGQLRNGDLKS